MYVCTTVFYSLREGMDRHGFNINCTLLKPFSFWLTWTESRSNHQDSQGSSISEHCKDQGSECLIPRK